MKNKIAIVSITSALLLSASPTFAYDTGDGFVGAQYAMFTYSESGIPDFDMSALVLRGGYFFNKYFSLEGRLGFGIGDDTNNVTIPGLGTFETTLELDSMYGIYAVGHIPVSQRVDLYGALGYSDAETKLTVAGASGSGTISDSDLSIGLGADFLVSNHFSLNIEYMSYISGDFDLDALSLGVNYNF